MENTLSEDTYARPHSPRRIAVFILGAITLVNVGVTYVVSKAVQNRQGISTQAREPSQTATYHPLEDAYVTEKAAGENFGFVKYLRVDNDPKSLSYLKFDLSALGSAEAVEVEKAVLRLQINDDKYRGTVIAKKVEENAWSEDVITFKDRPREFDERYRGVENNGWVEFDVYQPVVAQQGKLLSLVMRNDEAGNNIFFSKDSSSRPELRVVYRTKTIAVATPSLGPTVPMATTAPTPTARITSVPPTPTTRITVPTPTTRVTIPTPTVRITVPTPTIRVFPTPTVPVTPLPTPIVPVGGKVVAFPGAEGFGANTKGGRGGRVIYVTNLNDSGAGSFRDAVSQTGARTVVFKVSGTIGLLRDIEITQPYLTIAAQTAPGQGVQIKGGMIKIVTHDVIARYLKVRKGNPTGGNAADTDSVSVSAQNTEVYNVILDHSSLIWGTDIGGASILTNAHDITFQDSIFGEGLYLSNHPEGVVAQGGHSMSLNVSALNSSGKPTRLTLYRNLITSSDSRNPQFIEAVNADFVNNVLYNWGAKSAFGNPHSLNLIKNMYVYGPLSRTNNLWNLRIDADWTTQHNSAVYESGNATVGFTGTRGGPSSIYAATRFSPYSIVREMMPVDAYNYVMANAGATKPVRDSVEQRLIDNVVNRTMRLPNGTVANRFVNDTDLVWPNLAGGTPVADSDNDGMSDSWEQQHFGNTSRGSAFSSTSDFDADGYTDLEEYLNSTDPTR